MVVLKLYLLPIILGNLQLNSNCSFTSKSVSRNHAMVTEPSYSELKVIEEAGNTKPWKKVFNSWKTIG